jgi:hypothetical protein
MGNLETASHSEDALSYMMPLETASVRVDLESDRFVLAQLKAL